MKYSGNTEEVQFEHNVGLEVSPPPTSQILCFLLMMTGSPQASTCPHLGRPDWFPWSWSTALSLKRFQMSCWVRTHVWMYVTETLTYLTIDKMWTFYSSVILLSVIQVIMLFILLLIVLFYYLFYIYSIYFIPFIFVM